MEKKILYIDMDNVLVDYQSGIDKLDTKTIKKYKDRVDEVPGLFRDMIPLDGAIEAYKRLSEHYDVYILSTAPWNNPTAASDKVYWVKKYLGDIAKKRLILTHHKNLNRGDFLIDDRTKNGAGDFQGELIQFGTEKFRDWNVVIKYLILQNKNNLRQV